MSFEMSYKLFFRSEIELVFMYERLNQVVILKLK